MKSKSPLLLIMSFLLALLLAVSIYVYLNTLGNQGEQTQQFDMIVASVEIPQYTKITKDMITTVKVLQLPPDSSTYYSNEADVVGKYAGERIIQGEQFFKSRILERSAGNLSLTLKGNNRAVAVMANLESGVAKLIKTGDYIDVLVSLPEIKDQDKVIRPDISKIILQKILVLAVDQTTTSPSTPEGGAAQTEGNKAVEDIFYLTLSVPVPELEKLALAENIGRLKFALRPKGDNSLQPTDGAIWQELLARAADGQSVSSAAVKPTTPTVKPATVETQKPADTKKTTASTTKSGSAATTKTQYVYYVVKAGDTLMNIARTQMNDASQYKLLQKINNIADPNHIRPGTRIKIPVTK